LFLNLQMWAQNASQKLEETAGVWEIDESLSELTFAIENFYMGTVKGVFKGLKGVITIDEQLAKSSVNLSIQASTLEAGNEKRDEHLKDPDFFDTEKHPLVLYQGSSIEFTGDKKNPYTLKGILIIKEIRNPLDVPFNHALSKDGKVVVFVGKTIVSKNDFNLDNWKGVGVGETATVTFKVVAKRK